jgi:alkyl sulfatase BDS1-like metallo-beta-lactamase superfamily hydrolase
MVNPYDVERRWPDYFLEHRTLVSERAGTYRAGDLPVWTVHCPEGYIGNSTIIEGDDGLIVYDTGMNVEAGAHIRAEIAKITDKPIKAVFYSHHHPDHYGGTTALVDPDAVARGDVRIYAWANFEEERRSEFGDIWHRQAMGAAYYGGALLPPEERHHHAIGVRVIGGEQGFLPPTVLLVRDTELTIAGVRIHAFYTGGEAISEFGFHLPDLDLVIIADEFFLGLPNLHSIRGSKPRIPDNYVAALDRVREIGPEWLLGSHIMPIQGRDQIHQIVTTYRDATQWMWDQSIRHINKGYTPVELQHKLRDLPGHLWDPPYTVPTYGTPWTAVPEFFTGWVSWFSGDATDLLPTEPRLKAERLVALMGGTGRVLDEAKRHLADDDPQFAAELAQLALRAEPGHEDARLVKAAALRARGYRELNSIARSWYLTGALELEGAFDPADVLTVALAMVQTQRSAGEVFTSWRYLLDADAAGTTHLIVAFDLTDVAETWTVELRNGILDVRQGSDPADPDATVVLDTAAANALSQPGANGGQLKVNGDPTALEQLFALLDREPAPFLMHQR